MKAYRKLALERIKYLLDLAEKVYEKDPTLARRYVELVWKLKTRYVVRIPRELKMKFCKKCFSIWISGKTVRVRVRKGIVIWTCLSCGRAYRIPFKLIKKS